MNEEYNRLILRMKENIQKLILLYTKEKENNKELSKEVKHISNELNIYINKNKEVEKKYENLKLAKALDGINGEDKEAKLKLNKIIREIDNCIALLNK
jgi:outer membrane protein assembly factor BamE (lipoprotein component of BamABCDE complex)